MGGAREAGRSPWAVGAAGFAAGYGLLRLYWAAGGRWGYSACGPAPEAAELATGCGAARLEALPFWQGWGAAGLSAAAVAAAVLLLTGRRAGPAAAWAVCAALVVLSFPMHLVFQVPAALLGRPTDWPDLADRALLLAGGLLFGQAAWAAGPGPCAHPAPAGPRPVPGRLRAWAHAACAVPLIGWGIPHALWFLGVPFGIGAEGAAAIRQDIGAGLALALVLVPVLAGQLAAGLAHPWGQVLPRRLPRWGGRAVPRRLVLLPAGAVAAALTAYGAISTWTLVRALVEGEADAASVAADWAVSGTLLVFLAWGLALGAAVAEYARLTDPRCAKCRKGKSRLAIRDGDSNK
ncbi:hypothetical protein [Nocardiopsis potens]|uniref:hypothetical protein n=1 Tax=Nocardiopsis potens TaxID=1246458 RepID=UPI000347BEFC|nr:hypothetical protein [Nocardiopsis potens]